MKLTACSWPLTLTLSLLGKKVLLPFVLLWPVSFSWPVILCWRHRERRGEHADRHTDTFWGEVSWGAAGALQPLRPLSHLRTGCPDMWRRFPFHSLSVWRRQGGTRAGNPWTDELGAAVGTARDDGGSSHLNWLQVSSGCPPTFFFFNGLSFQSFFHCVFPSSLVIHHSLLTNYHGKLHPRQHGRSLTCVYVENTTSSRR